MPKTKEELYRYPLAWKTIEIFDLVNKEIRPWLAQQMIEYIGQVRTR